MADTAPPLAPPKDAEVLPLTPPKDEVPATLPKDDAPPAPQKDNDAPPAPPKDDLPAVPPKDEKDCGCEPPDPSLNTKASTYTLLSPRELISAGDLPVLDSEGTSHTFRSLYEDSSAGVQRNLVIFIRHFFCGLCQQYITHLSSALPPKSLAALAQPTRIIIIGCGDSSMIKNYITQTGCAYPLYADGSGRIYKALKMGRTAGVGRSPDYMEGKGFGGVVLSGIKQVLMNPGKLFKAGDWQQVGGEFLFVREGEGWDNRWAHRMQNSRDHAEVKQIKEVLGNAV